MASATFPVRLLSGEVCYFDPDMSVSEIRAQLNQNFSAIHETSLCLGDAELGKDLTCSISEVSPMPGFEVLAVTQVSLDKAIAAFTKAYSNLAENINQPNQRFRKIRGNNLPPGPADFVDLTKYVEEMMPVLEALEKYKDGLNKCHCQEIEKDCWAFPGSYTHDDMPWKDGHGMRNPFGRDIWLRSNMVVLHLWAKFGDVDELARLNNLDTGFCGVTPEECQMIAKREESGKLKNTFARALTFAVRQIEARISKPPAEQPSQEQNGHVQGPADEQVQGADSSDSSRPLKLRRS